MGGENRTGKFESGSPREVAYVAWPIVVSMLSYTAMGVCDTLFVGWLGKTELAAVGIATTAFFLVNALFLGTLRGVKVVSAQLSGADRPAAAVAAGWAGAALAVPFGGIVVVLGLFDSAIFAILGGTPSVQALAGDYFSMRTVGAGFWYVAMGLSGYFQGTGDTKTPMKVALVANGANVVLDPLLVFGVGPIPALGVEGAALATVVNQGVGMIVAIGYFLRRIDFELQWQGEVVRDVLRLGAPMGVQQALSTAGFTAFTALIARMGEAELAAHQVVIKIISVSFLPGHGISQATSILTGQYVGADDLAAARRSFRSAMGIGVALMGAFGLLFFAVPEPLVRIFNTDAEVVSVGTDLLWVAAMFQVVDAVAMVASGALNGTGDTAFTMWVNISCSWLVLVPAAFLFGPVLGWGAVGAWVGLTCEILAVAVVLLVRFLGRGWESKSLT